MSSPFPFDGRFSDGTRTRFEGMRDHVLAMVRCEVEGHDHGKMLLGSTVFYGCWRCMSGPWMAEVGTS